MVSWDINSFLFENLKPQIGVPFHMEWSQGDSIKVRDAMDLEILVCTMHNTTNLLDLPSHHTLENPTFPFSRRVYLMSLLKVPPKVDVWGCGSRCLHNQGLPNLLSMLIGNLLLEISAQPSSPLSIEYDWKFVLIEHSFWWAFKKSANEHFWLSVRDSQFFSICSMHNSMLTPILVDKMIISNN